MRTAALSAGIKSGSKRRSERRGLLARSFERSFSLNGRRSMALWLVGPIQRRASLRFNS